MKFKVHLFEDIDLTIHEALEPFVIDDIIEALDDFYKTRLTKFLIWDLNNGGDAKLTTRDMEQIVQFSRENGAARPDGKSAIVTNNDLYFGISRMFETYAETSPQLSLVFRVFREVEDAKRWLLG